MGQIKNIKLHIVTDIKENTKLTYKMDWLLGKQKPTQNFEQMLANAGAGDPGGGNPGGGSPDGGKSGGGGGGEDGPAAPKAWSNFDPSGLERAAKAARELDASKSSQQAYELTSMQEHTKQLEHQKQLKEYEVHIQQVEIEKSRVQHEEKR